MRNLNPTGIKSLPAIMAWAVVSLAATLVTHLLRRHFERFLGELGGSRSAGRSDSAAAVRLEQDPVTGVYRPAPGQ